MNEYHEQFEQLQDQNTFKGQQWFGKRQELVEEYAWAVPNEDVLTYLSEFDELVEIGAGSGYWSHCIEERGGSIDAYDIEPPDETWTHVSQADVYDCMDEIRDNPVLMVWPPFDKPMASQVVADGRPSHVLYVGEREGGCTANDRFFDFITERYALVAKIDIPSYVGVNDDFYHYVRKV